jgi:glycosyltransferase involved in cell wall biosynthesis
MAPFILNILPRFGIGGKETTIINIIIGMRKRHLDGMLCCDGGDGLMDLARHDISWVHVPSFFPSSRINALQSFVWLRHIVHQYNPDLIVSHHRFSSLVGRAVARSLNVAYISMVHDLAAGNRVISHVALGGTVTVFSQAVKSHLITQFRLKEERIQVIPMGIGRVEKLGEEEVAKIRSQVICLPETRVVGFAGRLAEEKAEPLSKDQVLGHRRRQNAQQSGISCADPWNCRKRAVLGLAA